VVAVVVVVCLFAVSLRRSIRRIYGYRSLELQPNQNQWINPYIAGYIILV
jgi:hypothetical protein